MVKNDLVDEANSFDAAKVKADADGFKLSDDYKPRSTSTAIRPRSSTASAGAAGDAPPLRRPTEAMSMLVFDHVGITAHEPQPGEDWVEQSRCWVTNPRNHPEHIEFLRYEPDSTVPEVIKNNPHVAFRVEDTRAAHRGTEILIPPFVVGDFLEVVFVLKHNTVFEYMRYLKEGWFDRP